MREKREAAQKQEKPDRANKHGKSRQQTPVWKAIAGWLLALGLLSLFFQHRLDLWQNPNQNVAVTSTASGAQAVRLKRNRQGHYVVTGRINGQEVVFMLNTGATTVSVPEKLAPRLGLARGAAQTHSSPLSVRLPDMGPCWTHSCERNRLPKRLCQPQSFHDGPARPPWLEPLVSGCVCSVWENFGGERT